MRTFRSKVLTLTILVVLVSQLATVGSVLITARDASRVRAEQQLIGGGGTFKRLVHNRGQLLTQTVRTLASDFAFKEAVATGDTSTLASVLENHSRRANADLAVLADADGNLIVSTGGATNSSPELSVLIETNDEPSSKRSAMIINNQGYEMLTVPVLSPLPVAWVSMGFLIDNSLAKQMSELAGLETTFIATTEDGLKLIGSSLPREERALLVNAALSFANAGGDHDVAVQNLRKEYLSTREDFVTGPVTVFAILQKSMGDAMAFYESLRTALIQMATLTMLCAVVCAVMLSRTVTRPVRDLLQAARRMRVGNYSKKLKFSSRDEFGELANAFNDMQRSISEREQRISYQATHDGLTGLPNRLQAMDLLRKTLLKCARIEQPMTLLIMHLQRYREIESSLGHEIGDEVLLQSAKRMRDSLKEKDVLARLEGDQFLVVLPGADRDAGLTTAETLARLLDSGLTIQNINVTLDACIGMCVYPEHGRQPDELLRRAAVAKNDAQQSQKNVHVYQNGREARHVRQLAILGDMRRAATDNEWELHYQPKISLNDGSVSGAEALLRWNHPELGQIPPAEFVPLAENAGNVGMLTEWVLRNSIAQARNWQEAGLELAVAVNLSGRDLLNDKLPYLIMQILRDNELDARSMIFEITEEALVQDIDHAIMVLKYLRDMGAKISMDDFGTGYSSLSQLQLLPVDELKIDRAFITDLPDSEANTAIVRSVIELAHNLGLELVAEGVETVAALDWLREHGCERAQGFYISKPMPAHKLKNWVDKWIDSGNKADDSLVFLPRRPIKTP